MTRKWGPFAARQRVASKLCVLVVELEERSTASLLRQELSDTK